MKPPRSVWGVQDRDGTWFSTTDPAVYRKRGYVLVRYVLPPKPKARKGERRVR